MINKKIIPTIIISIALIITAPSTEAKELGEKCERILQENPTHQLCLKWQEREKREEKSNTVTESMANRILFLTNEQRRRWNLPELTLDAELSKSAQKHAEDMARNNFFNHLNLQSLGPTERIKDTLYLQAFEECNCNRTATVGENLAKNQQNPNQVVRDWMRSLEHRRNILKRDYQHLGVGFVQKGRKIWWVQNFGGYELNLSSD